MIKIFTGFAAFILTFGVSVSLVGLLFGFPQTNLFAFDNGNHHSAKYRIRSLLVRDVKNGRRRDRRIIRFLRSDGSNEAAKTRLAGYHGFVVRYVRTSSEMNDAGLPADFRYAWREHMRAWNKEVGTLTDLKNGNVSQETFKKRYSENSEEIRETWEQVLRIASRYGVNTRSRFYH